jgi:hypothetical protein
VRPKPQPVKGAVPTVWTEATVFTSPASPGAEIVDCTAPKPICPPNELVKRIFSPVACKCRPLRATGIAAISRGTIGATTDDRVLMYRRLHPFAATGRA